MTERVDLALPCRLISLKVTVGPKGGATTLEELAAKAMLAGRTTVERLIQLFGLPRRLMLDVVLSLFEKGYVSIDVESGAIALSETTRSRLVNGESMRDAATKTEDREFLFEPITGRILSSRDGQTKVPDSVLAAPVRHGIRESSLPPDELLRAVQTAIHQERREGFRKTVLEVGFGHPLLRPPAKLRWVTVPTRVTADPDTGRLLVTLTDRKWDARDVTRMEQHMAALAAAEPGHRFVQELRGQASQRLESPEDTESLLERFSGRVERLRRAPSTELDSHHQDLIDLSARLTDRIEAQNQARANVTVVSRTAGQQWAFEYLIGEARTQLVIAAPAFSYRPLNLLLPALRDALDRRVQLVVLWGRTLADSLPDPVRAAFDGLRAKYRSWVLIADRSARIDACAVIQDGSRALVGSHSFAELADPDRVSEMVSVLIEPTQARPDPPTVVTDLLTWTRDAYPYWQEGQRIAAPRPAGPAETAGEEEEPPEVPDLPEDADEAAVGLLADTWEEYRAALADTLRRGDAIGPVVELLRDGENQEFLWHGIRDARRRLIVADDNIDPALLGRVRDALHKRTDGGTVDLVFQSTASRTRDDRRRELRRDIRLHQRRPAARLVIADDQALIGSFSPLGDDGSRFGGLNGRRQLGVRIRGRSIATELALSAPAEVTADDQETDDGQPRRTRSAAAAALPLLAEARQQRRQGRFGSFVAARLAELDQPWAVLDAWAERNVPADDLRPAAAALVRQAALARQADPGPGAAAPAEDPRLLRWTGWLLTDAWRRGQFVAAAVLAGLVPGAEVTPRAAACLAAAPIELGPLGEPLADPQLELAVGGLEGPAASGGAGALAELMLWGNLGEGLDLLAERLPPTWRDLADAARRFYADSGGPVPLAEITAELSRWDVVTQREGEWADLADRIDRLERRRRFNFDSGLAMQRGLFSDEGLLARIRRAARDAPVHRKLPAQTLPRDVRAHLDGLVASADAPAVQWGNQLHFLGEITDIVRRARSLTAPGGNGGTAPAAITSRACRELASRMAGAQEKLLADANSLLSDADGRPLPYGLPLRALLERLEPLIRWGEVT